MTHIVLPKENLYRIGLRYGCTAEHLRLLNGLSDYSIKIGQRLIVPDKVQPQPIIPQRKQLKPSDLCITEDNVPLKVMDALIDCHYVPICNIMKLTGLMIWASLRSGYRPEYYEIQSGRGAGSQHTFEAVSSYGCGAIDWTTKQENLDLLQEALIKHSNYRRIARYATFIHADYKDVAGERRLYSSTPDSNWTFIKTI